MSRTRVLCISAFVLGSLPLFGQTATPAPSLPPSTDTSGQAPASQSNPSIFVLPRNNAGLITIPAHDKPAEKPAEPREACFAPAEGHFASRPRLSPELQQVEQRYTSLAVQNLDYVWKHGMPRAAKDPWLKGARVTIRFTILKDGNIDTPQVTVSSGRDVYDKHALDAVYKTAPFAPLPDGIGAVLPICMNFSYNESQEHWQKPVDLWPTKPATPPGSTNPPAKP